jgi:hypothetical protein
LLRTTDATLTKSRRSCVVVLALTTRFLLSLVWRNCATDVPHSPWSLSLPPLLL